MGRREGTVVETARVGRDGPRRVHLDEGARVDGEEVVRRRSPLRQALGDREPKRVVLRSLCEWREEGKEGSWGVRRGTRVGTGEARASVFFSVLAHRRARRRGAGGSWAVSVARSAARPRSWAARGASSGSWARPRSDRPRSSRGRRPRRRATMGPRRKIDEACRAASAAPPCRVRSSRR